MLALCLVILMTYHAQNYAAIKFACLVSGCISRWRGLYGNALCTAQLTLFVKIQHNSAQTLANDSCYLCLFHSVCTWALTIGIPVTAYRQVSIVPAHPVTLQTVIGHPGLHQPVWRCFVGLLRWIVKRSGIRHRRYWQWDSSLQCLHFVIPLHFCSYRKLWILIELLIKYIIRTKVKACQKQVAYDHHGCLTAQRYGANKDKVCNERQTAHVEVKGLNSQTIAGLFAFVRSIPLNLSHGVEEMSLTCKSASTSMTSQVST